MAARGQLEVFDVFKGELLWMLYSILCACIGGVEGRGGRGGGGRGGGSRGGSRSSGSTARYSSGRYSAVRSTRYSYTGSTAARYGRVYSSTYNSLYTYYYSQYFYYPYRTGYYSRKSNGTGYTICANYEDNGNGSTLGLFRCPMPFEPADFTECCGEGYAQYCCQESNVGLIVGVSILCSIILLGVIWQICCRYKNAKAHTRRVEDQRRGERPPETASAPVFSTNQAQATAGAPNNVPPPPLPYSGYTSRPPGDGGAQNMNLPPPSYDQVVFRGKRNTNPGDGNTHAQDSAPGDNNVPMPGQPLTYGAHPVQPGYGPAGYPEAPPPVYSSVVNS